MATVNKNFRIKNGLVVEGSTATVNGQNILTETGGDQYILNLIGGETLVKSVESTQLEVNGSGKLSVKSNVFDAYGAASTAETNANDYTDGEISTALTTAQGYATTAQNNAEDYADGLAVNYDAAGAAATAQQNAESYTDNAINALDTDDIEEGTTNKYFTNSRAKTSAAELLTGATLTNITISGNGSGLTITAENGVADSTTDDLTEGTTNKYFTNQRALDATAAAYDAAGAAATAETNAQGYTDTAINGLDTDDIEEGTTNKYFTNQRALDATAAAYDAAGAAATAQQNAENYADGLAVNYDAAGSASAALSDANDYTDQEIAALVNGAPALLDTLNELAAAINDDASFASTIGTSIGEKVAKSGDTMTGALTLSGAPTVDLHAATKKYVDDAQTAAENYADGLASNYDVAGAASTAQTNAENYADGLVDDILDATTAFTAINLNSVAKEVAATATIASAGSANAITWSASAYRTAKALVKFETATHSQVSEVLLTLDASNNIAITEYAEVGTNGSLGTVSASYVSGTVAITVTTAQANTDVMVKATLLA